MKPGHETRAAIDELKMAKDSLYAAAVELLSVRLSDPIPPQLEAFALGIDQVLDVLEKRERERRAG